MKSLSIFLLCMFFVFGSSLVMAKEKYLIDIPSVPVKTSPFAKHLQQICYGLSKSFPKIKKLASTPSAAYTPEVLTEWDASTKPLNSVSAEDKKLLGALDSVNTVCEHLRQPSRMTDNDLDTLRQIRMDSKSLADIANTLNDEKVAAARSLADALNVLKQEDVTGVVQGGLLPGASFDGIESRLVDGLAEFINTRAKAEAALYLQQQLRKELCEKTVQRNGVEIDLGKYFSNLCIALKSDETYISLNSIGVFLQNAAQRDLENLPENVFTDLLLQSKNRQIKEALVTAMLSYTVYKEEKKGRSTLDIVRGIADVPPVPCEKSSDEPCRSVKLARFLSLLTRSIQEQDGFRGEEINLLYYSIGAMLTFEDYIQDRDNQEYLLSDSFKRFSAGQVKQFLAIFNMTLNIVAKVENGIGALQDAESDNESILAKRVSLISQYLDSAEYIIDQVVLTEDPLKERQWIDLEKVKVVKGYIKVAQDMTDFGQALLKQDGSEMAFATLDVVVKMEANFGATGLTDAIPAEITKALPFVIEIANAKTSAEVANVIEAAAAPVGSYSHKFKRKMTTINSFFGVTGGYEQYQTSSGDKETVFYGAYVPVGIHFTVPKNQWNWGAFLSILDLGTYAVYREDDTDITANVGFDQVVSPGAFLTYANKSTGPLTVGLGVSVGNKLVTDNATEKTGNSYRAHAFLALDLTLFAF
ncbi:hypothetical protein [Kaarinaea lacus]